MVKNHEEPIISIGDSTNHLKGTPPNCRFARINVVVNGLDSPFMVKAGQPWQTVHPKITEQIKVPLVRMG